MPNRRAIESNYYEELGIAQSASPIEVRDAFRALVRLLHPDHQINPELKEIAERHMRRLNGIYAVLSDAEKRRDYDLHLDIEATPPAYGFNSSSTIDPKRLVSRFVWAGALLILGGSFVWLFLEGFDSGPSVPTDRGATMVRASAPAPIHADTGLGNSSEIENLQTELRMAKSERDAARYEVSRLRAEISQSNNPTPVAASPAPAIPSAAPLSDPLPSVKLPPPDRALTALNAAPAMPRGMSRPLGTDPHQFAGFWFFALTGSSENKNLYPPQFIEATLTERSGVIHGSYRSRYRIVDRAISPDVNFEFSGTATGTTVVSPWTGPGGAKGIVTLTLVNENSLKLDWTASDVGSVQGLASGTATLTRRID